MTVDIAWFERDISEKGWYLLPNVLTSSQIDRMRNDCLKWIDLCAKYQISNGINTTGDGTAHHAIGGNDSIDDFIDMHLMHPYLEHYFSSRPYILHACNPVGGFPKAQSYVHRVHRDAATYIPSYNFRMNMLIMLDDFTIDNGATKVLAGSHSLPNCPIDIDFENGCESIVGSAGSIVLFNSYLWHRAGTNITEHNRVALTLSFGPAFIKPQMDYARLLGEDRGRLLSPLSRQVLGFNSRVPTSLDEWYKPKGDRLYCADQG